MSVNVCPGAKFLGASELTGIGLSDKRFSKQVL
jgi:hypothetical protein